ncbi:unnamed protein product [Protopolystoma xenopodis]|uniref:Uncharacterized protein n=1 Tax=Protopolystoma xenopodis TaxID=117903 RepID=A0A3S5A8B9_9PLAT|nr:unnamed protein product [Protopolystoma xenopodis]
MASTAKHVLRCYKKPEDSEEEFVVPHMDISCLRTSMAYQKVLEEPWTCLHNWDSLSPSHQQSIMQSLIEELTEIKGYLAISQDVFTQTPTQDNWHASEFTICIQDVYYKCLLINKKSSFDLLI